jgi:SWI/SNF related-matrix-associated actin-dependent regulator of chromatin subfamily C
MEALLEEERRSLEISRLSLVAERQNIKRMLSSIRLEMVRNGTSNALPPEAYQAVVSAGNQGTKVTPLESQEVTSFTDEMGPVADASYHQLV